MSGDASVVIGRFASRASAEAFRAVLRGEGVASWIRPRKLVAGLERSYRFPISGTLRSRSPV